MSSMNIATLPRITASSLREFVLDPDAAPSFVVIDVRDNDYIGGHIKDSKHVPSSSHATALPELARKLADKQIVILHCMLCQQRTLLNRLSGPKAALEYARTRERLLGSEKGRVFTGPIEDVKSSKDQDESAEGDVGQWVGVLDSKQSSSERKEHKLTRLSGFAAWQQAGYGEDARLTEGYDKRLWDEDMLD
ncbi:MAG: hypothetical protein Q9159_006023 [Coniocarpon cinnabarinum]